MMNINLLIEQILLEDIDLSYGERLRLQSSVESELSQLLTANGLAARLQGGTIPTLSVSIDSSARPNPILMGSQIAQSIYQSISEKVA